MTKKIMHTLTIRNRIIGPGQPCFIVAEMSANHHQKYEEAVQIIRAAKDAGADAVKLQTYTPDTITMDSDKEWFIAGGGKDHPADWKGKTLYQLYQTAYTPWEWQPKLKQVAEDIGLILFSTPFDESAVDFLETMNVPCYKIASYEVTHVPLLKKVASTKKPVIMSVGFASQEEIELALDTLRTNGATDIALLHCVTAYIGDPKPDSMDLRTIQDIHERFGVVSGFSDNNGGIEFPVLAAAAGASIIEKHFTLSRKEGGPDAQFSIEPSELGAMVNRIREMEKVLGKVRYGPANDEEAYNRRYRQSIFVTKDIKKGERLTRENIRVIRPEFGLAPKFFADVLGHNAVKDIERGIPLAWEMIEK